MARKTIISVFVLACALCARASAVDYTRAEPVAGSAQDFSDSEVGDKELHLRPDVEDGLYFWSSPDKEPRVATEVREDDSGKYLYVNADERADAGLMRTFAAQAAAKGEITNALVKSVDVPAYSGFYTDFRLKVTVFEKDDAPNIDGGDRLVVWARKNASDASRTDLFVTAGRYDGSVRKVVRYDYPVKCDSFNASAWHELTIRMIPDITTGMRAPAFELWLDRTRLVVPESSYPSLAAVDEAESLTSEALAMISSRRLFPSLIASGDNASMVAGGAAFTGIGSLDDISVSVAAPAWVKPTRVFTLNWDNGPTGIVYRIGSLDAPAITVPSIATHQVIFEIPAAATDVYVSDFYDTASSGYSRGLWSTEGSCSVRTNIVGTVTNLFFKCEDSSQSVVGNVRSFRNEIGLGPGGVGTFATFTAAKQQALLQHKTLVLKCDFAASRDSEDGGKIEISRGEELTIDLNGHLLGNMVDEYPTIRNYGKLTIIDSVGNGRVAPYSEYIGETNADKYVAINNRASKQSTPELSIRGGVISGVVLNDGVITNAETLARMEGRMEIYRSEYESDAPRFISDNAETFKFEDKIVEPKVYYFYRDSYWRPLTNACIWCGRGADNRWSNPDNWRGQSVPKSDDYLIFPNCGTNYWTADLGAGAAFAGIRLDGDVLFHGTNDFTGIEWASTTPGRVRGDATLIWKNELPSDLSTLLDDTWAGTVSIVDVGDTVPVLLKSILSWGVSGSKVEFRGVRGYYHLTSNLRLPYELVMENGAKGYAWKNDAGFTGGTIEIPVVSGKGDFVSPENAIANRQLLRFTDISRYEGKFEVLGKRVVMGTGDVVTLEPGSLTWSEGLVLDRVVTHKCRVAAFGGPMTIAGRVGDQLAHYVDDTVGAESVVVTLSPAGKYAELCVTNPPNAVMIADWSEDAAIVDGRRVVTNQLLKVNSLSSIRTSSVMASKLQFANYYTPSVTTNGQLVTVKLALNQNAIPVIGGTGQESAKVTFANGMVSIVVTGAIDNFWYGLEYKSSLTDQWPSEPYVWTVADPLSGGQVELIAPAEGASGFYRVVVSDVQPSSVGGDE